MMHKRRAAPIESVRGVGKRVGGGGKRNSTRAGGGGSFVRQVPSIKCLAVRAATPAIARNTKAAITSCAAYQRRYADISLGSSARSSAEPENNIPQVATRASILPRL